MVELIVTEMGYAAAPSIIATADSQSPCPCKLRAHTPPFTKHSFCNSLCQGPRTLPASWFLGFGLSWEPSPIRGFGFRGTPPMGVDRQGQLPGLEG